MAGLDHLHGLLCSKKRDPKLSQTICYFYGFNPLIKRERFSDCFKTLMTFDP